MTLTSIKPFRIERWFDEHEMSCTYNIAETCAASLSIDDLKEICETPTLQPVIDLGRKMLYGEIRGSKELRSHLANLYSVKTLCPLPPENILITNGAIGANFLALYLVHIAWQRRSVKYTEPSPTSELTGNSVICHYPTYQQLYSVPESLGAEVDLWRTHPEDKWQLNIDSLRHLIRPNTKMIIINNPQNPTGAIVQKSTLEQIVALAAERDIIVFADEVYRPLFHSITPIDSEFPPSILSMNYDRVVATSSMSKAFALAGIRVGWLASRSPEIVEACAASRDYTTISVSQLDDQVATFALDQRCIHALLSRNINLAKTNLAILESFIENNSDVCSWVKPRAGTTAMVKFSKQGRPVDDVKFCQTLQESTGVLLAPGNYCFSEDSSEFHGYVRIGFVCATQVLKDGLGQISTFLKGDFSGVPIV